MISNTYMFKYKYSDTYKQHVKYIITHEYTHNTHKTFIYLITYILRNNMFKTLCICYYTYFSNIHIYSINTLLYAWCTYKTIPYIPTMP